MTRSACLGILFACSVFLRASSEPAPVPAASAGAPPLPVTRPAPDRIDGLGGAPLVFERAADDPAAFIGRAAGYDVRISRTGVEIGLAPPGATQPRADASPGRRVHLRLTGARDSGLPADATPGPAPLNYLIGPKAAWRANQPTFTRVRYPEIYPGVDLVFHADRQRLEYDFIVAPGISPDAIGFGFSGFDGAFDPGIGRDGAIALATDGARFRLDAPFAYQDVDGILRTVPVAFTTRPQGDVGFEVGPYDTTRPLVIDPVLGLAMALGGTGTDSGAAVAVDPDGYVYVVGTTASSGFTAQGQGPGGGTEVFVTKLDPTGSTVLYSTYIGGAGPDLAAGAAVDAVGQVFVVGTTGSQNFPASNANGGGLDAFVLKLSAAGNALVYARHLGGSGMDEAAAVAIDAAGAAYVAGTTQSPNFPVLIQRQAFAGLSDGFVTKVAASGQSLLYSTFLGGTLSDAVHALALDATGGVVVAGVTDSTNFPMANQAMGDRPGYDAFVTRLGTVPSATVFSTYLGGAGLDSAQGVAVVPSGHVIVGGTTSSTNLPVVAAPQPAPGGGLDAFVSVLPPSGGSVIMSTYLGGSGTDRTRGVSASNLEAIYVGGQTDSPNLPLKAPFQPAPAGRRDAFVAMLGASTGLWWSTYVGGPHDDEPAGMTMDAAGRLYLTGTRQYPLVDGLGFSDAFVDRLSNGNPAADTDGDGMPDEWETQFNLDPFTDDADADPDGDGLTNHEEWQAYSHPRGSYTRFLAEGATGDFFTTVLALLNPGPEPSNVLLRFLLADGSMIPRSLLIPPYARASVVANDIPGLESHGFATTVEADTPIVADRTMSWKNSGWNAHYGSHAETASSGLSTTWYFAEGATHHTFDLFYLIENPGDTAARVEVTYLLPQPVVSPSGGVAAPLVKTYTVPPHGRFNVWVDQEDDALESVDVSATFVSTNGVPVLVERAMYMRTKWLKFGAGHASAGVTAPAERWFLAEGATGTYFDLFVLVANPSAAAAAVRATFLLPDGSTLSKTYTVAGRSRFNIWVDGVDARLASTAVSTIVESTNGVPIVVERAMWWPGPTADNWLEAHNSFGSTVTGTKWALADGQQGGTRHTETYILIANTSSHAGTARVTLRYEDDGTSSSRTVTLAARSRFNVDVHAMFPESVGRRFGAEIQSVGGSPAQLVVERAMYSDAGNDRWAAGTNALGTLLAP